MMLQALMGAASGIVNPLAGATIVDSSLSPAIATAALSFSGDGSITGTDMPGQNWYLPTISGIGANYYVRATVTSGSLSSGTAGAWLALSSTRTWSLTRSSVGVSTCVLLMEIAVFDGSSYIVVSSGTYTLIASVEL